VNVVRPSLLVDMNKCRRNIEKMVNKAKIAGVAFRPHFKTHQSLEIGQLFKEYGVSRIAVSSLDMALYFAEEWDDIVVAIPININAIEIINILASKIQLHILVERIETILFLKDKLSAPVGVYIEVDTGYGRTGIPHNYIEYISDIANAIEEAPMMKNSGLLDHAGHTYNARGKAEIRQIAIDAQQKMSRLAERILPHYPDMNVSSGDTPTCSAMNTFGSSTEIRTGNFCFYDLTQWQIGSCELEEIAICMACPIIATYPDRQEVLIHGGGVHFSKDVLAHPEYGTIYGLVVHEDEWSNPISDCYITKLSQEHGTVKVNVPMSYRLNVGDTLYILPAHSCLTADAMPYYADRQDNRIEKWGGIA
jgi:D-serine deaminase-like pyridoxal phosphate-dependent protein